MSKKILLSLFLFLALPLFLFSISAQEKSERWVCLKAERAEVHSATVSVDPGSKLLPASNTYVFECLSSSDCTSGNATVDLEVFGKNNLGDMQGKYGYNFEGSSLASNPVMSDGAGEVPPFTWQSSSEGHDRRWLAMNYLEPIPAMGQGDESTQQIGTFSFEEAINKDSCVALSWDPYGRLFDSSTLEPVSGASVTLLVKRGDGSFTMMTPADLLGGNIINPQTTKEDGGFSFVVPDGTYKLSVAIGSYSFPEQLANLQSNYYRIYSDIYPSQTGEEIVQAGVIQHRDIPLTPKSASQSNEAKLMDNFYDLDKVTSTIYVKGRVSHPFAQIKAYSLKPDPVLNENVRYRLLTEVPVKADALGSFTLKIDQSKFEPDENFGDITVEKVDLTQSANLVQKIKNWFFGLIGQVDAQVVLASNFRFEPIPNYLEGYAYDAQGNAIPNAKVSVLLSFSNKPAYQSEADENGYFRIGSEFLPSMPYRVKFTSPTGQVTETTTSRFIVQNQSLIEDSQIKVNQFKNAQGEVLTPPPSNESTTPEGQSNGVINQGVKALTSSNTLPFVLALVVTLVLGGVAAFVYFKKKSL
ncbi:carboxypeptidase regulatory-like domain-containing protein [Candidatus Roizmanbacteria bacterium]|nr:carboxypeptidase regulatory-like domain-containing protein [Candidatus Roizmanbacteria bacterium]